jgi:hypothetical protein
MKGPMLFLLSVVGAAAVSAVLTLPVVEEAEGLSRRLRERPARDTARIEKQALDAVRTLERRLDPSGRPAIERLRGIALAFAPLNLIRQNPDAGEISLVVPWAKLPGLLSRLAGEKGLALALLEATDMRDPEMCRVRVRLEAP